MKKVIIFLIITISFSLLLAKDWNLASDISLTMNQNAYSDNWTGEEKGSISWVFNANFLAEKQLSAKVHNKNTLKLAFGQTHTQMEDDLGEKYWAKPDKSTDIVDFESIFRFTLGAFVDPFASFRDETQFMDETYMDTKIFNPNVFTETFGVAKVFFKDDDQEFSTRLGGAFKQYFDSNLDESTNDGGVELVGELRKPFAENVIKYSTTLNLYKPIVYSESESLEDQEDEDDWKQVRMDWQHDVDISLTKLINLKLFVQLLYNKMQAEDLQFKETLGLGLNYKLF
ncbi:MAG: DUF3078 domain-containing protein [Candidatus Cloacimonetes bacterium]|jgi:hypothetical protein|nr:DUF3078 domain-containing protein [Candidatus Cloacimonadota bacterium]MBT4333575.1 DUF3078 domain-containing protein [Candidatus Cloacimonadota bacterium]MBT4575939.1 DUF3078 domain-containing protein [Candidatus Cloacimonadota bacterium]MBT5420505.1 DUF3078 domain-containing protein [Candidatus Cloacimonadota bacterium]